MLVLPPKKVMRQKKAAGIEMPPQGRTLNSDSRMNYMYFNLYNMVPVEPSVVTSCP